MITIPVLKSTDADGNELLTPAAPFPADAIAIHCDGESYIVYQQGDSLPA